MAGTQDDIVIRSLRPSDIGAALIIQEASYPAFLHEGPEAFASRIDLPSTFCLAAERSGVLLAYLLAHGWPGSAPPVVGSILRMSSAPQVLFIHDLAVSTAARGSSIGRRLVVEAFGRARSEGLRRAELIAVDGAAEYWLALGFIESPVPPAVAAGVATYGAGARWMSRDVPCGGCGTP